MIQFIIIIIIRYSYYSNCKHICFSLVFWISKKLKFCHTIVKIVCYVDNVISYRYLGK